MISSFSKVILVLGKSRSCRAPNLGCRGLGHQRDWMFGKKLRTRCDAWAGALWDEAASHLLPRDTAFSIIQTVSTEECSIWMQICCSTHSVILNAVAIQYTCSLNGIYRPHWLVQWSCHCSCTCIPVHSPWLPGCIDVMQTILRLMMAGLFPERPCVCMCVHLCSICTFIYIEIYKVCPEKVQMLLI